MSLETLSFISPIVIVGSALFFIGLERLFPYTKGQRLFHEGFFSDLFLYTFVQSAILSVVIGWIIQWIDSASGISRLTFIRELPIWVQVVLFVITHDLYIYLFHRWQHRNKWLYRIHEAHHSPKEMDWISGSRSHSLEILINQTIEYAPIMLLASPEIAIYKGIIDAVWGMYIHSNIDVKSGALQFVINGPEMHRWHHAKGKGNSVNYATKLAVWDWMFGTAYLPQNEKPKFYGLTDEAYPLSSDNTSGFQRLLDDAKSYALQHTAAFRPFKKPLARTRSAHTSRLPKEEGAAA